MYRNKKLLEAARQLECQHCGADDGTVCAAHSNQLIHGKGTGIKAHDWAIAALCNHCHINVLDQGRELDKDSRRAMWDAAHLKTLHALIERNILRVTK